jgi:serine protease Do
MSIRAFHARNARCLSHENRRTLLAIELFGLSLADARGLLSEVFGKLSREVVRDVVAFRAEKSRPPAPAAPARKAPEQESSATSGTGFFVGLTGHVVTNNHVVAECKVIHLKPGRGPSSTATIYARDVVNDLALLQTDLKQPERITLQGVVRLGEPVVAFGYPLAAVLASSGNFTVGHVAALSGPRDDSRLLQISAPIQAGNSGGPLLDFRGDLVGVVTSKLDELKLMQSEGNFPQNVNFAIKASVVSAFLDSHSVQVGSVSPSVHDLSTPQLAELARAMSLHVLCVR